MASLDEIAKALSLNKTDSKTDTLLGKVTSADPFTVQVQGNTIECLDFCGAGTGDVVVLQKLKNGTVAAISKAGGGGGGGGVPSGGTTGQVLYKPNSTSGSSAWGGHVIGTIDASEYSTPVLADLIYPVGSIYMSVSSTDPSTLFGGTWAQIQDTFLLAAGSTYSAGATGGEETHTLTEAEMPSHSHYQTRSAINGGNALDLHYYNSGPYGGEAEPQIDWFEGKALLYTGATGGGQAHNNMPPYLAVYVWKRTA